MVHPHLAPRPVRASSPIPHPPSTSWSGALAGTASRLVCGARRRRRCVELARKATSHTSPNPMVGCVTVRNGRVVGEGFHPKASQPHAELSPSAIAKGFMAAAVPRQINGSSMTRGLRSAISTGSPDGCSPCLSTSASLPLHPQQIRPSGGGSEVSPTAAAAEAVVSDATPTRSSSCSPAYSASLRCRWCRQPSPRQPGCSRSGSCSPVDKRQVVPQPVRPAFVVDGAVGRARGDQAAKDYLQERAKGSPLYGFKGGPAGIMK